VDADPRVNGSVSVVTVRPERAANSPALGKLQLTVPPLPALELGDRVLVVGDFEAMNRQSARGEALAAAGIAATAAFPEIIRLDEPAGAPPWSLAIHRIRSGLAQAMRLSLPEPQARSL